MPWIGLGPTTWGGGGVRVRERAGAGGKAAFTLLMESWKFKKKYLHCTLLQQVSILTNMVFLGKVVVTPCHVPLGHRARIWRHQSPVTKVTRPARFIFLKWSYINIHLQNVANKLTKALHLSPSKKVPAQVWIRRRHHRFIYFVFLMNVMCYVKGSSELSSFQTGLGRIEGRCTILVRDLFSLPAGPEPSRISSPK